jgi:murein L,D-transpeptidase YcbB/YkuD
VRATSTLLDRLPATLRGCRLQRVTATTSFLRARTEPAWSLPEGADAVLEAIDGMAADGLRPRDYHRDALHQALSTWKATPAPDVAAQIQVLATDAVATMLDDVRYGRARPDDLHPTWNDDPRQLAPSLDLLLARVSASDDIERAIAGFKPNHFIYGGLKATLARLRAIEEAGGWGLVASGPALEAGSRDARVRMLRRRLAASSHLESAAATDPDLFDAGLAQALARFQREHRLSPDGTLGRATLAALNVPVATRIAQVRANLERARWVVHGLRDDFVLVNLPAYKVYVIRDGQNVWETRAQVGRDDRRTPTFRGDLRHIVFNPDWTVPPTILDKDVLSGMRAGRDMLARKQLEVFDRRGQRVDPAAIDWKSATPASFPYTLRQAPGPDNALGRVKFLFPNEHAIFLHDTPSRNLFALDQRAFSSGCIRVDRPLELAAVLLEGEPGWSAERVAREVDSKRSRTVTLEQPVPVLIVYWTVSVGRDGAVRYAPDVYGFDAKVLGALDRP